MTDKERIVELEKYTCLSLNKLSLAIGLKTPQTFYDIKSGKHGISKDLAEKIKAKYLNLSMAWLLTGQGEMLEGVTTVEESDQDVSMIPLLPISAQGGKLNDFIVSVKGSDCEKVVSPIKGADFAMPVAGDSMAPEYPNGSQIHIKKINENAFIEWGKVYVLDTCNGALIKRIIPSEKEGYVKCVSINSDPIYAPFEVALMDIYGIYRVMLCLSIK